MDPRFQPLKVPRAHSAKAVLRVILILLLVGVTSLGVRAKDKTNYGEGLIVNVPLPESEVEQVVADIAQNGLIRGTKEYNKDQYVSGAKAADSSSVFPAWDQGGKVFYKVRTEAIDPLNFKESSDVGTLVVRYVLLPQGEKNTVLRIDALFQEDFRHVVHASNGSVESAEYKDIREHLDAIEVMKAQNVEARKERQEYLARKQNPAIHNGVSSSSGQMPTQLAPEAKAPDNEASAEAALQPQVVESEAAESAPLPPPPAQTLEEQVKGLRRQVQRLVKAPGAPLKSAPFHTASTLQLLGTGTEVLIHISTPYWYGVETHEGQHGWIQRDQLEQLQ